MLVIDFICLLRFKMLLASPKFDFVDIRNVVAGKTIKKEKPALVILKAPTPVKVSGPGFKKRKTVEILDLTLDDSEPAKIMRKLSTMIDMLYLSIYLLTF